MIKSGRVGFPALFLGVLALFWSCESTLDLPVQTMPRLTILAHLSPSSWEPQQVLVHASLSPSDSTQFYTPDSVTVSITDLETNDKRSLHKVVQEGKTRFPIPAGFIQAGHSYSVAASAPGFTTVYAITRIPEPSTISQFSIQNFASAPSDKHEFKSILRYKLVFKIDHLEDNRYYHLIFYNEYKGLENNFFIVNPELSDDHVFLPHYDYGVLLDRNDLKVEGELSFQFVDWVVAEHDLKTVYVELRTISEEYYRYHSTLARQVIIRQDPFAEPVSIFNNIEGGFGNFSGYSPHVLSSDLPN